MQNIQAMSQSSAATTTSNLSPIAAVLQDIERMLGSAHDEASILENKVEPIRATAPEKQAGEGVMPREVPPTQMEGALQNIHDTVRYLTARIRKINAELRI